MGLSACLNEREDVLNQLQQRVPAGQEKELSLDIRDTGTILVHVDWLSHHDPTAPSLINLNENISSAHESLVYYLYPGVNVFGSSPTVEKLALHKKNVRFHSLH